MWIGGGHHLTSTCHVKNVVEGMLLAAERGKGGEIYFLTDGAPTEMRGFMSAMLATRGVTAPDKSVPRPIAHALAIVTDRAWSLFGAKSPPPLVHATFHLIGEEVTVNDAKARRELGYVGKVARERGLAEMRDAPRA
jgi:nucleoside-diphosphate-sugar epimerase